MIKLTETQTIVLSAGAKRPANIALPLPKGLAGAAVKMAVTKMIERGLLQEVDANMRRGEPLWRETGDGHGTTLVVTDAGSAGHRHCAGGRQDHGRDPRKCRRDAGSKAAHSAPRGQAGHAYCSASRTRRCHDGENRYHYWLAGSPCEGGAVGCAGQKTGADCDFGEGGRQRAGQSDPDIPIELIQRPL